MTIPFTPFAVGANTPSHHEVYMDSEQFKVEIEASKQRLISTAEHYNKALVQQTEAYIQANTEWFERYHARQIEMSKDIKEILRQEGL